MSVEGHIESLERRHRDLDRRISELEHVPGHDHLEVAAMKRQKLGLKDELIKARGTTH